MLINRNITVAGLRTSVRLEPEFWNALWEIAERERRSVDDICTAIDATAGELSRTAAIRLFIVSYFDRARADNVHRMVRDPGKRPQLSPFERRPYEPLSRIAGAR